MSNFFGVDIKSVIAATFKGQLAVGTLTKVALDVRDPDNLTQPYRTETSYTFDGTIEDYTESQMAGTSIQVGDRKVIVLAGTLSSPVVPAPNDKITMESSVYKIVAIKRDPAGATYTCQVRK